MTFRRQGVASLRPGVATPWGLFFFFNEKKKLYLFFLQSVAKSKFLPIYEAKAAEAEGAKKK